MFFSNESVKLLLLSPGQVGGLAGSQGVLSHQWQHQQLENQQTAQ